MHFIRVLHLVGAFDIPALDIVKVDIGAFDIPVFDIMPSYHLV
jgi:hypothetical protein